MLAGSGGRAPPPRPPPPGVPPPRRPRRAAPTEAPPPSSWPDDVDVLDGEFRAFFERIDAALSLEDAEAAAVAIFHCLRRSVDRGDVAAKLHVDRLLPRRVATVLALVREADFFQVGSRFGFLRSLKEAVENSEDAANPLAIDPDHFEDLVTFRDHAHFAHAARPRAAITVAVGREREAVEDCLAAYSAVLGDAHVAKLAEISANDEELFSAALGHLCRRYWGALSLAVLDFDRLFMHTPNPAAALALVQWARSEARSFTLSLWHRAIESPQEDDSFRLVISARVAQLSFSGNAVMTAVGLPLDVAIADVLAPLIADFVGCAVPSFKPDEVRDMLAECDRLANEVVRRLTLADLGNDI